MEFQALGPLRVVRDGEAVELGPQMQRRLLALLLINHNEVVSTEAILESLWGDDAGEKKSALQVYVSRLRTALEPDRARGDASVLCTREPGYVLEIDPARYDVAVFDRLITDAHSAIAESPAHAAKAFGSALDLWRGEAFEEFVYDDFSQVERERLEQARVAAIEDRIDADLALGRTGELVSELERLRELHPLRERFVAQHMLALYRAGRAPDALRALTAFRRHLADEIGLEPSPSLLRLEEQILLHDDRIQGQTRHAALTLDRSDHAANPYMGLQAFDVDSAGSFFGRNALIAELLRTIGGGQRLVSLVGASGSGKSSVIRAGLVPALEKGAIPGSDHWMIASMMPGAHPFAELEAALLRSRIDAPASLGEQLSDPESGILRAVLRVLPDEAAHLVLVIDQFEELFTMVDSPVRERFLTNLVTAIDDPKARLTVVLTLRADFYGRPLEHPEFGARLGHGIINATPLTAEELGDAAVRPAEECGVQFEPSLLGQLIADVGSQPGGLPLFQYALTELFDRRSGDTLLLSSYRAMGGIEGALQRRADEVYQGLAADEQDAARQLLLRLVLVGAHDERSRRRVEAREIASLGVDTVTMQKTIAALGEHRLLSFDSDRLSGAPTVEVAHEALLHAWPQLEGWIDESRDDLRRHQSLVVAWREWQLADRNPDYLLTSARLAEFRDWQQTSNVRLNDQERMYLDASLERLEAEAAGRHAEAQRAAKGRRRLLALVAVLGTSLSAAVLFMAGVFAGDPGPTVTFFGQRNLDRVSDSIKLGMDRAAGDFDMVLEDVRWTVDLVAEFDEFATSEPAFVIGDSTVPFEAQLYLQYPEIRFGVVDPTHDAIGSRPNVSYVGFRNEEGAYLAGVAAASTTETGVVGFLGGMRLPLIEEFRAGFEAGVASIDPDVVVLATFVSTAGDNGFANPNGADARATALYERDADVIFHAAGLSGQGVFRAAERWSETNGSHVWGIGVDVDQWFDLPIGQREHVLTSMIKRQDVAAYALTEHFVDGGPAGLVTELGVAEEGYDYTTSGDAMSSALIARLDEAIEELTAGAVTVPTVPMGDIVRFDGTGQQVDTVPNDQLFNPDGLGEFAPITEGAYELESLGIPLTVEIVGAWDVQVHMLGHTVFSHPDSDQVGENDLVFLRPSEFADPTNPGGALNDQEAQPTALLGGLDGFEEWLAVLNDGIVSEEPSRVMLAGREAVYFEVELADDYECGSYGYCAGFLVNVVTNEFGISGWSFEPGLHQRVWVVDGGAFAPLVIIASTPADDRSFQPNVDEFLDQISLGEPALHPLDLSAVPSPEDLVGGRWVADNHPFKLRFNADGTYEVASSESALDTSPVEAGNWTLETGVLVLDTTVGQCPGILSRPGRFQIRFLPDTRDAIMVTTLDDPCLNRGEVFGSATQRRE